MGVGSAFEGEEDRSSGGAIIGHDGDAIFISREPRVSVVGDVDADTGFILS